MNPDTPRRPFDPLTPRKPNPDKVSNRIGGLSKSMRRVEELEKDYKKDRNLLTQDEKRLLDLVTFQKTGKHINEFKDSKPEKETIILDTRGGFASKEEARPTGRNNKPSKDTESVS